MIATDAEPAKRAPEGCSRFDVEALSRQLATRGCVVVRELMPRAQAERIGARLAELMDADPAHVDTTYFNIHGLFDAIHTQEDVDLFVPLMDNAVVLALAERQVGKDFQMSTAGGMRLSPRSRSGFGWHVDVPYQWFLQEGRPFPGECMAITALWMLSDFTKANGATRMVPFSHRSGRAPDGIRCDPDGYGHLEHEAPMEGPAGSCLLFDNAIWHSASENTSDQARLHVTIPIYPSWLDGGNVNWPPVQRRSYRMFPPHVQRLHRHVAEDRT